MWKDLFRPEGTLSKRQLGWLLIAAGALLLIGTLAADQLRDATGTFGTTQQLATAAGALSLIVGLTLLPLGDRPA